MRAAAFDTTSWWGGLALVEGGEDGAPIRVVAEIGLQVRESHTAHLIGLFERLLGEAGWPRDSIDAYATARGPGSFTGIRIGLGTVRGLALAAGRPCLGIGSLPALAEAFGPAERDRLPLVAAGRGEVYAARFDAAGSPPAELEAPAVGPAAGLLETIGRDAVVFGSGAEGLEPELRQSLARVGRSPRDSAAAVGRLALQRLAAGAEDGDGVAPLYIRPPDAILKPRLG